MRYHNTHKKHFKKYLMPEQRRLRTKGEEQRHPPQCGMEENSVAFLMARPYANTDIPQSANELETTFQPPKVASM